MNINKVKELIEAGENMLCVLEDEREVFEDVGDVGEPFAAMTRLRAAFAAVKEDR